MNIKARLAPFFNIAFYWIAFYQFFFFTIKNDDLNSVILANEFIMTNLILLSYHSGC